jgi:hypothetical protein
MLDSSGFLTPLSLAVTWDSFDVRQKGSFNTEVKERNNNQE